MCRRHVASPAADAGLVCFCGSISLPSLNESAGLWVAPHYVEPEKEQPITLARTLAAQMNDQR